MLNKRVLWIHSWGRKEADKESRGAGGAQSYLYVDLYSFGNKKPTQLAMHHKEVMMMLFRSPKSHASEETNQLVSLHCIYVLFHKLCWHWSGLSKVTFSQKEWRDWGVIIQMNCALIFGQLAPLIKMTWLLGSLNLLEILILCLLNQRRRMSLEFSVIH